MCERWGGRRRRRLGIQNQKQELHTELWGIKICNVFFNHKMAVSLRRKRDFSKIVGRCKICGVVFLLCTPVCFSFSSSSSFSSPPRVSHTHTTLSRNVTHNSFTHLFHTQLFHTHNLSHTHTQLFQTHTHNPVTRNSFTPIFVTHDSQLFHTKLRHAHTHTTSHNFVTRISFTH